MVQEILNIDKYIEDLKTAQKNAAANKVKAEAEAKKKKSESNVANRVKAEANLKFQYAETIEKSLIDFEGQLKNFARKIALGDVLTPIEQRDFDYAVKQYKSISNAYTTALNEGNKILDRMPISYKEEKEDIQKDVGIKTDEEKIEETATTVGLTDFLKSFVGNSQKIKQLQQALFDTGEYKGPINGILNADELVPAAERAEIRLEQFTKLGTPFTDRFEGYKRLQPTGGPGGGATSFATVSNPTQAKAYIDNAYQGLLGRDATEKEIISLTKKLNNAELKSKTKTVNGVTTGGINREQFLVDIVKSRPEYLKRKEDTRSLTVQTLQSTANANGISLSPQQLEQYALDIQNGKDVKVIQSQIRSLAGLGMPDNVKKLLAEGTDLDTIYSPYKQAMAAVLEINPTTIGFTDPVLRSAIGPNGEMPLYDFQRALRKDARWQYTNNAREDVFQSVGKVLQDFGFQG